MTSDWWLMIMVILTPDSCCQDWHSSVFMFLCWMNIKWNSYRLKGNATLIPKWYPIKTTDLILPVEVCDWQLLPSAGRDFPNKEIMFNRKPPIFPVDMHILVWLDWINFVIEDGFSAGNLKKAVALFRQQVRAVQWNWSVLLGSCTATSHI